MAGKVSVNIMTPEFSVYEFTIKGTTPLIVHAWSEKAKREMLDKQTKAMRRRHEVKIPTNDFMNSLYWLTKKPEDGYSEEEARSNFRKAWEDGAVWGFSLGGIKQSIIMGAKRAGADVVGTELRGSFFLEGAGELSTFDLARIVTPEPPVMREDMVRVGGMSKTADIRYRGEFREWEIPLRMRINSNGKYSFEQLINCVTLGGFVTGLGEWRPERNGQFGMYELVI